jgi:8-oxo-dGTP pyrophosphatase MutT (NUDIX family)
MPAFLTLDQIRQPLSGHQPETTKIDHKQQAAVAMILHPADDGLQMLFIERSRHPGDPWSGNLAFPGGRVDPGDADARAAAERETDEELGLDLKSAELLGRLDDITGAYLPVQIACFVYLLTDLPQLRPNEEVTDTFWFPCDELLNGHLHGEVSLHWQGKLRTVQAIDLLGPGRPVLWGITYRLVTQLLVLLGCWEKERLGIIDD